MSSPTTLHGGIDVDQPLELGLPDRRRDGHFPHACAPSASDSASTRPLSKPRQQCRRDDRLGRAAQRQARHLLFGAPDLRCRRRRAGRQAAIDRAQHDTTSSPMAGAERISLLMRVFQRCSPVAASSATMSPWLAPTTTRPRRTGPPVSVSLSGFATGACRSSTLHGHDVAVVARRVDGIAIARDAKPQAQLGSPPPTPALQTRCTLAVDCEIRELGGRIDVLVLVAGDQRGQRNQHCRDQDAPCGRSASWLRCCCGCADCRRAQVVDLQIQQRGDAVAPLDLRAAACGASFVFLQRAGAVALGKAARRRAPPCRQPGMRPCRRCRAWPAPRRTCPARTARAPAAGARWAAAARRRHCWPRAPGARRPCPARCAPRTRAPQRGPPRRHVGRLRMLAAQLFDQRQRLVDLVRRRRSARIFSYARDRRALASARRGPATSASRTRPAGRR